MVFSGPLSRSTPTTTSTSRTRSRSSQLNDASFTLRARDERRARLRLPLRLPRLPALEIIQERLEREYNLDLITTAPTVRYRVVLGAGEVVRDREPGGAARPDARSSASRSRCILATIHVPQEYVGAVLALCQERRGDAARHGRVHGSRVQVRYELPLAEVVLDFHDRSRASRAATARWTTTWSATSPATWSSSTCS